MAEYYEFLLTDFSIAILGVHYVHIMFILQISIMLIWLNSTCCQTQPWNFEKYNIIFNSMDIFYI